MPSLSWRAVVSFQTGGGAGQGVRWPLPILVLGEWFIRFLDMRYKDTSLGHMHRGYNQHPI